MKRTASVLLVTGLLAACASAPRPFRYEAPAQPEAASGYSSKPGWATQRFSVAAANPLAADAGYQVLKAGGSAVDAAVAVQMVLSLVEPQSSGIGGGAFLLHFNGRAVEAFDGRETAPANATEQLFVGRDGKPMAFNDAVVGGRAVGTPGAVRMLELAHQQYGKLPWHSLFTPAINLAENGFVLSHRLHTLLAGETQLINDPVAAAYFYAPDGKPHPVGHRLRNPELAHVLRLIAEQGANGLMQGEVAQAMVSKVQGHTTNPGLLTLADLAHYQPKKRAALCHAWRAGAKDYSVCGFPPPSSGGIAIGQILGMLASTQAGAMSLEAGVPSAPWLHLYTEAARLAFADRAQYLADPDFVDAPGGNWASLLAPAYLAQRAQLIGPTRMHSASPGMPEAQKVAHAAMPQQQEYGTSHISIVDAQGHALAMTSTIEAAFGSRQMVNTGAGRSGGFLLNNQLTDFSLAPTDARGVPIANRVQGGKRPRSSMSPTLVFDASNGQLVMSAGSPGGALIIHFTAKTLYGSLQWGLNAQQAIDLPNFGTLGGPVLLEEKRFSTTTINDLKTQGHEVLEVAMPSGLQAIEKTHSGYFGGADPRREGVVMGD